MQIPLIQNPGFRRFWLAKGISAGGSQITFIALPLVAVLNLGATPVEMGILTAAGVLPYLLFSLPAGVWADRLRRRPVLILADLCRAVILISVPLAALVGRLSLPHLYVVALLSGVFALFYDVTEEAFLPSLVEQKHLVSANSKIAVTNAVAEIAGPGLGGGLVQLLTAPGAILADVLSFALSAMLLTGVKVDEPLPLPAESRQPVLAELRDGLWFIVIHPLIRPMVIALSLLQLFGGMGDALRALFLTDTLGLPPVAFGLMYAAGSLSGLVTALVGERVTRRLGMGPAFVVSILAIGLGWLVVAGAVGSPWTAFSILGAGMLLAGFGNTLTNIIFAALVQSLTPAYLLGRVNASGVFLMTGMLPIGALIGGWLGAAWGLRPMMILSGAGMLLGFVIVLLSPLRLKSQPLSGPPG